MTPKPITENTLFYGDNLPILREYIPDESVDLIYLDPPFNSQPHLQRAVQGRERPRVGRADHRLRGHLALEPRRRGDLPRAGDASAPEHVSQMIAALRDFIGANQMMAYLVMMAVRGWWSCTACSSRPAACTCTATRRPATTSRWCWIRSLGRRTFVTRLCGNGQRPQRRQQAQGMPQYPRRRCFTMPKADHTTWNTTVHQPYDRGVRRPSSTIHEIRWAAYRTSVQSQRARIRRRNRPTCTYEWTRASRRYWRYTAENEWRSCDRKDGIVFTPRPGTVPRLQDDTSTRCRHCRRQDVWTDIPPIYNSGRRAPRLPHPEAAGPAGAHHRRPAATPATWCSTPSAAAARPSPPPRSWAGAGSASTSPTCPSPCKSTASRKCSPRPSTTSSASRRASPGRAQLAQRQPLPVRVVGAVAGPAPGPAAARRAQAGQEGRRPGHRRRDHLHRRRQGQSPSGSWSRSRAARSACATCATCAARSSARRRRWACSSRLEPPTRDMESEAVAGRLLPLARLAARLSPAANPDRGAVAGRGQDRDAAGVRHLQARRARRPGGGSAGQT